MNERPDTQLHVVDPRGLLSGYARLRGHRDMHGAYVDQHSVLGLLPWQSTAIPVFALDTMSDPRHPAPSDLVGLVSGWRADETGLFVDIQLLRASIHFARLINQAQCGVLYICPKRHPHFDRVNLVTGYESAGQYCAINLTTTPTYRPTAWPLDVYLDFLLDETGSLPPDAVYAAENETTPIGAPLPAGVFLKGVHNGLSTD